MPRKPDLAHRMLTVSDEHVVSAETLGRLLGLSTQRLRDLHREGHVKQIARGRYAFMASLSGYLKYIRESVKPGSVQEELLRHKVRLARVEADLAEGSVAKIAEIEADRFAVASLIKQRILAVPSQVAPLLAAEASQLTIHNTMTSALHDALSDLATHPIEAALSDDGPRGNGDPDAPAEVDD